MCTNEASETRSPGTCPPAQNDVRLPARALTETRDSPEGEESHPGGLPVGEEESQVRFYRPVTGDQNVPKQEALANTQKPFIQKF